MSVSPVSSYQVCPSFSRLPCEAIQKVFSIAMNVFNVIRATGSLIYNREIKAVYNSYYNTSYSYLTTLILSSLDPSGCEESRLEILQNMLKDGIEESSLEKINEALERGADINYCYEDDKSTLLHEAVSLGNLERIERLYALGCDHTVKNKKGLTAFQEFVSSGSIDHKAETLRLFLKNRYPFASSLRDFQTIMPAEFSLEKCRKIIEVLSDILDSIIEDQLTQVRRYRETLLQRVDDFRKELRQVQEEELLLKIEKLDIEEEEKFLREKITNLSTSISTEKSLGNDVSEKQKNLKELQEGLEEDCEEDLEIVVRSLKRCKEQEAYLDSKICSLRKILEKTIPRPEAKIGELKSWFEGEKSMFFSSDNKN